jgi:hypothetical protein
MAGVVGRPAQREEIEAMMFVSSSVLLDGEREVMDSRRATRKVLGSGGETLVDPKRASANPENGKWKVRLLILGTLAQSVNGAAECNSTNSSLRPCRSFV